MSSHSETKRPRFSSRHLRMGPFFKALIISIVVEFVVLFFTFGAIGNSMMRHSALAPRTAGEDLLSGICVVFHLPSLLIATPLGLFLFAPLIQIALMTCIIGLVLRARTNKHGIPHSLP